MAFTNVVQFLDRVQDIGVARSPANLQRRIAKVYEELGEVTEAVLNVTCSVNYKKKTISDIVEEAVDCIIVLADCFYTDLPYGEGQEVPPPFDLAGWIDQSLLVDKESIKENYYETIAMAGKSIAEAMSAQYRDRMQYHVVSAIIDMIAIIILVADDVKSTFLSITERKLDKWIEFLNRQQELEKGRFDAAL